MKTNSNKNKNKNEECLSLNFLSETRGFLIFLGRFGVHHPLLVGAGVDAVHRDAVRGGSVLDEFLGIAASKGIANTAKVRSVIAVVPVVAVVMEFQMLRESAPRFE